MYFSFIGNFMNTQTNVYIVDVQGMMKEWCLGGESNHRYKDIQSLLIWVSKYLDK